MRKEAQEKKKSIPSSPSHSNCSSSISSSSLDPAADSKPIPNTMERNFFDTGGLDEGYSMDEIWNDIDLSPEENVKPVYGGFNDEILASPIWDYCPDSLWSTDQEDSKTILPTSEPYHSWFGQGSAFFTEHL